MSSAGSGYTLVRQTCKDPLNWTVAQTTYNAMHQNTSEFLEFIAGYSGNFVLDKSTFMRVKITPLYGGDSFASITADFEGRPEVIAHIDHHLAIDPQERLYCAGSGPKSGTVSLNGNKMLVSLCGKDGSCMLVPQTYLTLQQTDYEVNLKSCTANPRFQLLLSRLSRLEELVANVTGNTSVSAGADNRALASQRSPTTYVRIFLGEL